MMPVLACGICLDKGLFSLLPFTFYWTLVFLVWSLVLGLPLRVASWAMRSPLQIQPLKYFLIALGLLVGTAFVTGGSVALPLTAATSLSLSRIRKSLKQAAPEMAPPGLRRTARRIDRIFFTVCLLAIPVSYVRLWLQGE